MGLDLEELVEKIRSIKEDFKKYSIRELGYSAIVFERREEPYFRDKSIVLEFKHSYLNGLFLNSQNEGVYVGMNREIPSKAYEYFETLMYNVGVLIRVRPNILNKNGEVFFRGKKLYHMIGEQNAASNTILLGGYDF